MTDLHELYVEAQPALAVSGYRTQIEAALAYACETHTYADVAEMVAAGRAQFWPGPASCIVTELISTPRKQVLHFFLAAGHQAELEAMTPFVLEWGREQGCSHASFIGRKGWLRSFLPRTGWTDTGMVVMEKAL